MCGVLRDARHVSVGMWCVGGKVCVAQQCICIMCKMQRILRVNEVGLLVVEEASTTTWNPDQGSDARQQVRVVVQVSSHRESGRVARRQARQERVESAGPGKQEVSETRCDLPF
ncbi:hypothetical protein Pcinc_005431 [Petrolisthes cinctipes]|uniref:Uncharacterized protein n=1 Tax=Petrolisthes cinctipes TaxID=88211 RepID=A0AAE1L2Q1_PETCI|nr:hypothetical protein Pcinc_011875 [Petrolisthes cinctipes]KAK3890635.1 hypothetical protein Pcinc_005431 [Petrolisthes cinctipes]